MTDSRQIRLASPRTWAAVGALAAVFAACAASPAYAAEGPPYGEPPRSLTWNAPPDFLAALPGDGGCVDVPRAVTELDVWTVGRDGRPSYRLRQRGRNFYRGHLRAAWYPNRRESFRPGRGSVCSAYDGARYGLRVYGWWS